MRAIFQSNKPNMRVNYKEVNIYAPVVDGVAIELNRLQEYVFSEGKDHNQLTLTDPTEIENMRIYIKDHNNITEIGGHHESGI